jgi:hypothetical protein
MAGNWQGEEKMHPSPWEPKGGTAVARLKSRLDLSGFALITDYEQERGGVITFTGHSVMTYNAKDDLYSLHWFDCMGSLPEVFTGRFRGDVLVVEHGGPGMHARLTYDLSNPRQMRSKMEMSQDGVHWNTLFEGSYTRS